MEFRPSRLALARRRRGLRKRDLAGSLAVSERSVVGWESGATTPSQSNVEALAKQLDFPVRFFCRGEPERLPDDTVSFRALSRTRADARDRALAGGEMALELNEWLEKNFRLPAPSLPDLRHHAGDAEGAALALRSAWALGDAPIANMVALLERQGVRVFSLAEDCLDIDAFSFWRAETPFIFLNTKKSAERSRFDAAHELAHLVLHRHGSPAGRPAEREADAFAASFLMPHSSIVAYAPRLATLPKLVDAKRYWNVAVSALAHRMHEVSLISDWHYRSLCIQIQKTGMRTSEPEGSTRELSKVFEKVFRTLRSEGKSRHDVARELAWPVADLNALVFGLILHAADGGGSDGTADRSTSSLRLMH